MSDLRALAHLEEQLGPACWRELIDSLNTADIRKFLRQLVVSRLPIEMRVGDHRYEILSILRDETSVSGDVLMERAKEMKAHLGKDDCDYLLKHQMDIPTRLCGEVIFIFTAYRCPSDRWSICFVRWNGRRWYKDWVLLNDDGWSGWSGCGRVLRRIS